MKNRNSYPEIWCAIWGVLCSKKVLEKCVMKKNRVKSKLRRIERGGYGAWNETVESKSRHRCSDWGYGVQSQQRSTDQGWGRHLG